MHYASIYAMDRFAQKFLDVNKKLKILEIGSASPSKPSKDLIFRRIFRDNENWEFTGMDVIPGWNVDVVSEHLYNYPFDDNSFDVVISGNTLEHVQDTHRWIRELTRITSDLVCVIVPSVRPEHKHPIDCWRVYPDGMKFLLVNIAGLEVLKCQLLGKLKEDTIGVGRKI